MLEYIGQTTVPVELEGFLPETARERSLAEIEQTLIHHGNQRPPLAEFFRVSGDPSDEKFELRGDFAGVHWIGAKQTRGEIRVVGPAGRHVGSEMSGGRIIVEGDAGDWVGGEMRGGLIHVRGSAGHLIGSAYRGSPLGMTGGTILIDGDVGNEIAHTMRRGLLAIGGSAGDFAAVNMIAGSVFVFGGCGIRPAAGMRRGTLALLGTEPPPLLPTFRRAGGHCRPQFVPLYLRYLVKQGFAVPPDLAQADLTLYHGDLLTVGAGEILTRCAPH